MRTEEEVLKDFEKYGTLTLIRNDEYVLMIIVGKRCIEIDKECKCHYCYDAFKTRPVSTGIRLEEHKLLNELFSIWDWL